MNRGKGNSQFPGRTGELVRLFDQGLTWHAIAVEMGLGHTCVRDQGRSLGLRRIVKPPVKRPDDEPRVEKIRPYPPGCLNTLPPLPSLQLPMPVIKGLG